MCRQTLTSGARCEPQFALSCLNRSSALPCPASLSNMQKRSQTTHCGLRSDDLAKNRPSPGGLDVVGDAPAAPIQCNASADRSWFDMSANEVSACSNFAANSALNLPRSRSPELIVAAERARSRSGLGMSEATTAESNVSRKTARHPSRWSPRLRLRTWCRAIPGSTIDLRWSDTMGRP